MTIKSMGLVAALAFAAAACSTKEAAGPLSPSGPTERVRFVNLITDPTRIPVNAILESVPFGVNLGYGATTPSSLASPSNATYSAVLEGQRSLVLKRTADTSVVLATISFVVGFEGGDRTIYATGGTAGAAVTSFTTSDANPVPTATQVQVRIVNMSPSGGAQDVFVTAPNADLSTATPTAANLAYQQQSPYVVFAPGTYQIRSVPAGTAPAARAASVTVTLSSGALNGGTGRTVVIADRAAGGAPLTGFILIDR